MKRLDCLAYPLCILAGFTLTRGFSAQEAQVESIPIEGFSIEVAVTVPGTPEEVFDAFTGDISPWWDHHHSENPTRFVIEPRPGGHFLELFDDAGNGVVHADVTWADRGKKLVFVGPLGLHGRAVQMVHTFSFETVGDGTKLSASVRGQGEVDDELRATMARVWKHFLIEQFAAYVKSGR